MNYALDNDEYTPVHQTGAYWDRTLINMGYMTAMPGNTMPSALQECPESRPISSKWDSTIGMNKHFPKGNSIPKISGPQLNETWLLMDSKWGDHLVYGFSADNVTEPVNTDRAARHQNKANTAFADGHVSALSAAFLLSQTDLENVFWHPLRR